jgi:hypothetical protein
MRVMNSLKSSLPIVSLERRNAQVHVSLEYIDTVTAAHYGELFGGGGCVHAFSMI